MLGGAEIPAAATPCRAAKCLAALRLRPDERLDFDIDLEPHQPGAAKAVRHRKPVKSATADQRPGLGGKARPIRKPPGDERDHPAELGGVLMAHFGLIESSTRRRERCFQRWCREKISDRYSTEIVLGRVPAICAPARCVQGEHPARCRALRVGGSALQRTRRATRSR